MKNIKIDVRKIQGIALLGVRRAAVFMGLGINAARDSTFREYELAHITGIDLVPSNVDSKTIDHFKDEFQLWIIESGFRELLERFALFLDSIHHHSLLLATNRNKLSPADAEKLHKKFEYAGVAAKLKQLGETFGMSFQHAHYLETLAKARNCLTHRLGIVGEKDCDSNPCFELRWRSFDIFADAPDKEEPVNLSLPMKEPIYFREGGTINLQVVDRVRRFSKGEKLSVSSKDLAEICHFVIIASHDVSTAMIDYAKLIGGSEDAQQGN
jgi:hypothetical protein